MKQKCGTNLKKSGKKVERNSKLGVLTSMQALIFPLVSGLRTWGTEGEDETDLIWLL